MKKVNIKSIELQGFRSFQDYTKFEFKNKGLFAFVGENGAGKTSLFEAFYFCLTGNNLKGESTKELLNDKQIGISAEFLVNVDLQLIENEAVKQIKVVRQYKNTKSSLYVFVDGVELDGQHKADRQQQLYDILEVTETSLLNTVIFGQRMQRILEASNTDKRKLLEELFDVGFVDSAREKGKEIALKLTKEIQDLENKTQLNEKDINNLVSLLEENEKQLADFEVKKSAKVFEVDKEISELNEKINNIAYPEKPQKSNTKSDVQTYWLRLEKIEKEKREFQEQRQTYENTSQGILRQITDLENKCEDINFYTCPVCFQKADKAHIIKELSFQITTNNNSLELLEYHIQNLDENSIWPLEKKISELKQQLSRQESLKQAELKYESDLKLYERELEFCSKQSSIFEESILKALERRKAIEVEEAPKNIISELTDKINSLKINCSELFDNIEELKDKLTRVEWWVKKGFGANGLKAYVFKYMLDSLNSEMQKYCSLLGVGVNFTVNIEGNTKKFEAICKLPKQKDRYYSSLSGGEKTRVDIIIAFGMFDVLKSNKTRFNLLFLDELFIGLDELGREQVFEVLQEMSKNTAVYFVTHEGGFNSANVKEYNFVNTLYGTKIS